MINQQSKERNLKQDNTIFKPRINDFFAYMVIMDRDVGDIFLILIAIAFVNAGKVKNEKCI